MGQIRNSIILGCAFAITTTAAFFVFSNLASSRRPVLAQPDPSLPAQQAAWSMLQAFIADATITDQPSGLDAKGWESRCWIIGSGTNHCLDSVTNGMMYIASLRDRPGSLAHFAPVQEPNSHAMEKMGSLPKGPQAAILQGGVLYNQIAADCIRKFENLPGSTGHCKSTDGTFFDGAMMLRPIWAVLNKKNSYVGVYDPARVTINPQHTQNDFLTAQGAKVDLSNSSCPSVDIDTSTQLVPVGCFYNVTVTHGAVIGNKCTGGNSCLFQTVAPQLNKGQTIILLGFHLIEKQDCSTTKQNCNPDTNGWTWATFWWQANGTKPNSFTEYSCDPSDRGDCPIAQPDQSQWTHYRMNTVFVPDSDVIPAVFNPYLDATLANNTNTNCLVCHSFAAAQPVGSSASSPLDNVDLVGHSPMPKSDLDGLTQSYFANTMPGARKTDSVWSLALYLQPGGADGHAKPSR
jgi:hypothetical protein